jgi:hypothetical protein
MLAATLIPKVDTLIEYKSDLIFLEKRLPTAAETRTNAKAAVTYTTTATIVYDAANDKWDMVPKNSRNPDGTKRGMILFILGTIPPQTTHIRVASITQNGRGARGTAITLAAE